MNNISELIVAVATALIPIVFAWIGKVLANNKKALSLLDALTPLAEAAVTAAAQLGVDKYLSGEAKKSTALVKGTGKLNLVGFNSGSASNFGTISTKSYSKVGSTTQDVSSKNAFCIYFDAVDSVIDIYIKFTKLELGSHATDWCPNSSEILTQADYAKIKAAIVALGGSLS